MNEVGIARMIHDDDNRVQKDTVGNAVWWKM
jgi:hypothetical protein